MTIFEIMRQYEGQYISIDVYEQRNEKSISNISYSERGAKII